jgi:hypothetical protein
MIVTRLGVRRRAAVVITGLGMGRRAAVVITGLGAGGGRCRRGGRRPVVAVVVGEAG